MRRFKAAIERLLATNKMEWTEELLKWLKRKNNDNTKRKTA